MAKNCTSDEEGLRAHGNELQEGLIEPASEGKVAAVGPTDGTQVQKLKLRGLHHFSFVFAATA